MNDAVKDPAAPTENHVAPEIDYDKLAAAMVKHQPAVPPTTAPAETPAAPVAKADPIDPAAQPADIVAQLTDVLDKRQLGANNEAMELMFDQQFDHLAAQTPGFSDFLAQADDYGDVRLTKLKAETDVKKRIETMRTLQKSYSEASVNTPGRKPVVNTREAQIASDIDAKYKEVYRKMESGEFKTQAEFANAHAELMAEEAALLQGG